MQRAVALNPGNTEPLALLGAYLTEAGRAREAGPHTRGALAHVFVTHGRLAVGPPGEEVELDAGDYAAVAADRPHRYEGRAPRTEALVLISLPRSAGSEGYVSTLTR